jgi:hypothetical protein
MNPMIRNAAIAPRGCCQPPLKGVVEAVALVEPTVRVTGMAALAATAAWLGFGIHVGMLVAVPAPWYSTVQLMLTVPENPLMEDT